MHATHPHTVIEYRYHSLNHEAISTYQSGSPTRRHSMKYKTFYRSLLGHSIPAASSTPHSKTEMKITTRHPFPPPPQPFYLSLPLYLPISFPRPTIFPFRPLFLHFASFVSLSIELFFFFFFFFFSFSRVFLLCLFYPPIPHSDSHTFHAFHTTRLTLSRFKNLHTAIVQGNHEAKFPINAAKTLFDSCYTIKFIPFSYNILPFIPPSPTATADRANEALSADDLVKARSSFGKRRRRQ